MSTAENSSQEGYDSLSTLLTKSDATPRDYYNWNATWCAHRWGDSAEAAVKAVILTLKTDDSKHFLVKHASRGQITLSSLEDGSPSTIANLNQHNPTNMSEEVFGESLLTRAGAFEMAVAKNNLLFFKKIGNSEFGPTQELVLIVSSDLDEDAGSSYDDYIKTRIRCKVLASNGYVLNSDSAEVYVNPLLNFDVARFTKPDPEKAASLAEVTDAVFKDMILGVKFSAKEGKTSFARSNLEFTLPDGPVVSNTQSNTPRWYKGLSKMKFVTYVLPEIPDQELQEVKDAFTEATAETTDARLARQFAALNAFSRPLSTGPSGGAGGPPGPKQSGAAGGPPGPKQPGASGPTTAQIEQLQREKQDLQAQVDRLTKEKDDADLLRQQAQDELNTANSTVERLERQVQQQTQELEELRDETEDDAKSKLAGAKAEISRLREQATALMAERDNANKSLGRANQEIENLKAREPARRATVPRVSPAYRQPPRREVKTNGVTVPVIEYDKMSPEQRELFARQAALQRMILQKRSRGEATGKVEAELARVLADYTRTIHGGRARA